MDNSDSIKELATALSKAQAVMGHAKQDVENPFFKRKYASLASVWDACRKPLTDNGLAVAQTLHSQDGGVIITAILMHTSGEWLTSSLFIKPMKEDPQALGSAVTYGRRYLLAALVGICPEDDDGNGASTPPEDKQEKPKPVPKPKTQPLEAQARATIAQALDDHGVTREEFVAKFGVETVAEYLSRGHSLTDAVGEIMKMGLEKKKGEKLV